MEMNSQKENTGNPPLKAGTILVTGANGQLGMELQQISSHYPGYDFIFLSKQELAIENVAAVKNRFQQHQPKYCINCAAYTAVDKAESEKDLAYRINAEAVGIVAAACKEHNTILIHISTDYVFNGQANTPYKEDAPVDPINIYGASKLEGERLAVKNNPGTIIIRTSWVYSSYGKNFVKTMLRLMSEKKELSVVNDQFGSPTYAADLAEAVLQIISKLTANSSQLTAYHYTNDGITSWYDFALAIKELSGSQCTVNPIPTSDYPTPAKRPAYSVLDKTKIQQTFGIELRDWKESLDACIREIRKAVSQ
jgi:dTDP-4-dehydrorhamnose reductase